MMENGWKNCRLPKTLIILACCVVLFTAQTKAAPTGISGTGTNETNPMVQFFREVDDNDNEDAESASLTNLPRCGFVDQTEPSKGNRSKRFVPRDSWRHRRITYRVSKYSNKLERRVVDKVMANAFGLWAGFGGLSFVPMPYGQVDIDIRFERGSHGDDRSIVPFGGADNILAHAFYPGPGIGGDIHFDDNQNWVVGPGYGNGYFDFFQIAVHEIGHSIGLDHSQVPTAIMWSTYRSNVAVRLDRDDIRGAEYLYGPRNTFGNRH